MPTINPLSVSSLPRQTLAKLATTGLAMLLLAGSPASSWAAPAPTKEAHVAWRAAANDADVERAFALARKESKPVLLYWGASWCPPCNRLKATLFNRQDFISQSNAFVAVNVDGDLPSAQKLGTKFKVRGYPTLILFTAQGVELTRLPGEMEPAQILAALHFALAGGRPAKDLLADTRAGKTLTDNEWRTLAFYSWETDEAQLVAANELPELLADLAQRSPAANEEINLRLWMKALAASDAKKSTLANDALRSRIDALLKDPARSRLHMDGLVYSARELVNALTEAGTPARTALLTNYNAALAGLLADETLARADRLAAITAQVELARLDQPENSVAVTLAEPLPQRVRDFAAQMDRDISNGYERQAVITETAFLLGRAGLWSESDALLKANLSKSHSPYYLMSQLAGNARKLERNDEALNWYQQAYAGSRGPATRLQWGSSYVAALIELAPDDAKRIATAAGQVIGESGNDRSAFHERSARSMKKVAEKLAFWNVVGGHDETVGKLVRQLDTICKKIPSTDPQRPSCNGILAIAGGPNPEKHYAITGR